MQMEVRKSWIEANELIARRRDFEIKQELCGSGSYYKLKMHIRDISEYINATGG